MLRTRAIRPQPGAGTTPEGHDLAAHSHQQRAGEPKPSDSPAHPGRRRVARLITAVVEDSRRLADRSSTSVWSISTHRRILFQSLSVKLQKNSCVTHIRSSKDDSYASTREEIERFADAIFTASPSQRDFWLGKKAGFDPTYIENTYRTLKPCLHGSDAHRSLGNPDRNRYCWIKGDLAFESLRPHSNQNAASGSAVVRPITTRSLYV